LGSNVFSNELNKAIPEKQKEKKQENDEFKKYLNQINGSF